MSERPRSRLALGVALALIVAGCTTGGSDESSNVSIPIQVAGEPSLTVVINAPASCDVVGCVGDGVDSASGAFRVEVEDLLFPSGLFGVELRRTYRSDAQTIGWFGSGWATIYETTVVENNGVLEVDAPAGFGPRWTPEAPIGWDVAGAVEIERAGSGYRFVWPTGETWDFAATGELARMTSPYGQALEIEHTPTSVAISSTQGVSLDLTFDSERVVSASSSDGRAVRYSYNDGRLVQAAAPGQTIGYRHDAAGRLVEYSLPAGATSITYDAVGRVVSQSLAAGERFNLAYDESSATVTVTNRLVTTVYEHDDADRLTRATRDGEVVLAQQFDDAGRLTDRTEYALPSGDVVSQLAQSYDDEGRVIELAVDGLSSSFEYDEQGRVTSVTGAGEAQFEYAGESPLPTAVSTPATGRSEITVEDGFSVAVSDETGTTSITERDAIGNPVAFGFSPDSLWSFEFDSEGNVTSRTSAMGRRWTSLWGPRSTLLEEQDALGRVSRYEYDNAGRLRAEALPTGTSRFTYTSSGQLASVAEPDGAITRRDYGPDGQLAAIVRPGDLTWRISNDEQPDGSRRETSIAPDGTRVEDTIDSAGRLIARRAVESDGSLTERTSYSYEFGRETELAVQRGQSAFTRTTMYDELGRVVESVSRLDGNEVGRSRYEFDRGLVVAATLDDEAASYDYDVAGRLVGVARGDDTWSATYAGGRVASVEHNGKTTNIGYDVDGRATTFAESDGTVVGWAFDEVDRPVARTVADVAAKFSWSDADLLVGYLAPSGASWEWSYDPSGRLTEASEPGGVNTVYEYEAGNISRIEASGPGVDRDDRFTYDARGLLASADTERGEVSYLYDATGRIRSVDDSSGDEDWTLDAAGAVTTVETSNDRFEVSYTSDGQLREISGPDEESLIVERLDGTIQSIDVDGERSLGLQVDDDGRLSSVEWNEDSAIDIDWTGAESFSVRDRGDDEQFDYIVAQGRLTSFRTDEVQYRAQSNANGTLAELSLAGDDSATLEFDASGRPATIRADDRVSSISYDERGRVSSVITSDAGEIDERTTVTYGDGERSIDGDDSLVETLFDESGAPLQPLPSSLPNPMSAAIGDPLLAGAFLVQGAEDLLQAQPDPFASIATSLREATPVLTSAIGVRDRERLAEQLLVAEVNRLSPTLSIAGPERVRIPIIDPDNGETADFNPFVDAAPSGLAFGVLAREAGAGGSLLDRALDTAGDIVGGTVSMASTIANFVVANPLAAFGVRQGR